MSIVFNFSKFICVQILLEWLGLKELMKLDTAVSSRAYRVIFLNWLREYALKVNRLDTLRSPFIHVHRLNQVLWSCCRTGRQLKKESLVIIQNTLYVMKKFPDTKLEELLKQFTVVRFDDVVKRRMEEDQLKHLLTLLGHVVELHCISCPDNFYHLLKSFNVSCLLKLTISVNDYDYYNAADVIISQCTNLKFLNIGIKDREGYRFNATPGHIVLTAVAHCRQLEFFSITSIYATRRREMAMLYLHKPPRLRQALMRIDPLTEENTWNEDKLVLDRLIAFHQKK